MMKPPNQLTWDNFRTTVIVPDQKRLHSVSTAPLIEIYSDGTTGRLGLLLEAEPTQTLPTILTSLSFIKSRALVRNGRSLLDISVEGSPILRQFYHFAVAVTERILGDNANAIDALTSELQCFAALLEEQSKMSIERQVGLIGELQFLERLMSRHGIDAADAWLGPFGEPHDFRIDKHEFEVKTTLSTQRIHMIHGAEQLVPSPDCSLFLISVLLGPTGKSIGFSLPELAAAIELRLEKARHLRAKFLHALKTVGYSPDNVALYSRRFSLRRPIAMIPVDSSCPAVTRSQLKSAMGEPFARIGLIQYEVNLEGLENEEGTGSFAAALDP